MNMNTELIVKEIKEILTKNLPKEIHHDVIHYESFSKTIYISIHVGDGLINNVKGQYVQHISFRLNIPSLDIQPQQFGCSGGQFIYRKPDKSNPKEKYLAMQGVKVPFRQPKRELKFVYSAIERICKNYIKVLKENKDVLMYQNSIGCTANDKGVDYSFLDKC